MDAVFPEAVSLLARTRRGAVRARRLDTSMRSRYRTQPVTFSEIKEVDEDAGEMLEPQVEERRRVDRLDDGELATKFEAFRRRRRAGARANSLAEHDEHERAGSEPSLAQRSKRPGAVAQPYLGDADRYDLEGGT